MKSIKDRTQIRELGHIVMNLMDKSSLSNAESIYNMTVNFYYIKTRKTVKHENYTEAVRNIVRKRGSRYRFLLNC